MYFDIDPIHNIIVGLASALYLDLTINEHEKRQELNQDLSIVIPYNQRWFS